MGSTHYGHESYKTNVIFVSILGAKVTLSKN